MENQTEQKPQEPLEMEEVQAREQAIGTGVQGRALDQESMGLMALSEPYDDQKLRFAALGLEGQVEQLLSNLKFIQKAMASDATYEPSNETLTSLSAIQKSLTNTLRFSMDLRAKLL